MPDIPPDLYNLPLKHVIKPEVLQMLDQIQQPDQAQLPDQVQQSIQDQYLPQNRVSAYRSPEYQPQALFQRPEISPYAQQSNIPAPVEASLPLNQPAQNQPAQTNQPVIPPPNVSPIMQAAQNQPAAQAQSAQTAQAQTAQSMPNYPRITTPAAAGGVRQMTPDYSYREIPKAPALAGSQENIPVPRREDFKRSRGTKITDAILAGLAGFGNAKLGIEVGGQLADKQYNEAMEAYKNLTADQKRRMEIDKEQYTRGKEGLEIGATIGKNTATDIHNATTEELIARLRGTQEAGQVTKEKDATSKIAHRLALERIATMQASKRTIDQMGADILRYPEETDEEKLIKSEATKEWTKMRQANQETPEHAAAITGAREAEKIRLNQTPAAAAAAANVGGSRTKASTEAKIEAETTPHAIEQQAKLRESQSWATATTNEKDSAHKAQIVQQRMPDIKKNIQTLASNDIFGNRWQEFMTGTLGTNPEFAPLRADIGMLQGAITNIHVGGRGSSGYLKKFEDMFNAKSMTRETLAKSVDEMEKWINEYAKTPTSRMEDIDARLSKPDKSKMLTTPSGHSYEIVR